MRRQTLTLSFHSVPPSLSRNWSPPGRPTVLFDRKWPPRLFKSISSDASKRTALETQSAARGRCARLRIYSRICSGPGETSSRSKRRSSRRARGRRLPSDGWPVEETTRTRPLGRNCKLLSRSEFPTLHPVLSLLLHPLTLKSFHSIDTLKSRHRKETQGIFVEVKHLKAVILRESTFRSDLSLQKEYLLILIGQLSRQYVQEPSCLALALAVLTTFSSTSLCRQARVYAAIAQLGHPHPAAAPQRRSFKSVALAVLMTIRAKYVLSALCESSSRRQSADRLFVSRNAARQWSRELETKQALKEAHERVRASRLLQPVADTQKLTSSNTHRQSSIHSGKHDHDAPRRRTSSTNNLPR